jgi:molybdopterin/thiamine biosynthesis adenylyltransferase
MEAALRAGVFPECFERNFPSLSAAEQLRVFESAALVVGLGGLGGALAVLLARVGVGRLLLADGDVFQPSNLNRQILATQATLGRKKAEVAAEHILAINPGLAAEAIPSFLTADTLPPYLAQVQVVLDGLDSLAARRQLFLAAQAAGVPLIHGAVLGNHGQIAAVFPEASDAFAKIYAAAPLGDHGPREALPWVVSLVASLQVSEAVRLLCGKTPTYANQLAYFDGDTGHLEILTL